MNETLLRQVPLFSALPASELERLARTLRPVALSPGALLFEEGQPGDGLYIIDTGQVEIIKALGTADERLLGVRGPGEPIGEMSLLSGNGRRTAAARARSKAGLLELVRSDFEDLLARQPTLAYAMVQVLSRRLDAAHTTTIHDLQEKNRQLTQAYEALQAAQTQLVEKERLERELQVARDIQLGILPNALPKVPGYDLGAVMIPARAVGGDFYDVLQLDEQTLGLVIGDVTDKGVPAAIFMARTHALWRAEAARGGSPGAVLARVNDHLLELDRSGLFVTVWYGLLDLPSGRLTYARAGHEPPLLCPLDGAPAFAPHAVGHPLGVLPHPALDEQTIQVPAGGGVVLYTDGLTDGRDPAGQLFGEERLRAAACFPAGTRAQPACDHLWGALAAFCGAAAQFDDVTVLTIWSRPGQNAR